MSTAEGTALKPSCQNGRRLSPKACIPLFISVFNPQGHIFTKHECSLVQKNKKDLYMIVQIPLNTCSYFFIFQFEHALKSPLLLKKRNNHS